MSSTNSNSAPSAITAVSSCRSLLTIILHFLAFVRRPTLPDVFSILRVSGKFAIKASLQIPPHLNGVVHYLAKY